MTVKATLAMIAKTAKKDRKDHPVEYKKAATQRGHVGDVLATVKDGESPSGPVSQGLV